MLRRYDEFGPRYTSYPTAPQFHTEFDEASLRKHARRSNDELIPRPVSIYIHVPYCFSPCFYCGCNKLITRDLGKGEVYLERLLKEIELVAPLFDKDREVIQVHFGGGTPNFLNPAQLGRLLDGLRSHFNFSSAADRDFSIELDPRHVNADDIAELASVGFNRASLGVQDFDEDVQQVVNRVQSTEQTLAVIDACKEFGLRSVNVDLIYGLPRQTLVGFRKTLATVIESRPSRLAIYGYAHMPHLFKAQKRFRAEELPDAEGRLALLALAVEMLSAAGYVYVGMDHFALPDDDLAVAQAAGGLQRNFMGYTTHADTDLLGLGVSSISHIGASFSQNSKDLPGWEIAIDEGRLPVWRGLTLDFDDELRAYVIQTLMCQGQINKADVERRFAVKFDEYFADELSALAALQQDGLVVCSDGAIEATSHGRFLLRIIAMCFDRYLKQREPTDGQARYSKAI